MRGMQHANPFCFPPPWSARNFLTPLSGRLRHTIRTLTAVAPNRRCPGVAGTMELLNSRNISTQPISCFDWSPDKEGLAVCGSFDQMVRVVIVTKTGKV